MDLTEKTVSKNYVYKGKILSLRCDDALCADGKPCKREIIEHSGGACVLYEEEGRVLLVRQYRYAYGECVLEVPAGKIDKGENPKNTALRELEEEAGIRVKDARLLYEIYPTPGYTDERIYLYQAEGGERVPAHLDEGEFVEKVWVKKGDLRGMLARGEIRDGKTIIAILHYLLG
jgi:ADP-ribose pyrophosphatase